MTSTHPPSAESPILTIDSLNSKLREVQYAICGERAIEAEELRERLKETGHGLPFDKVISPNIGDPQQKALDQKPLTFPRQVAALLEYPFLATVEPPIFPPDVLARANELSHHIGSIGAYTHSQGIPFIRQNVAAFISARDGFPSDSNHIFLTAGSSSGISLIIEMLISQSKDGILIPIPQHPLYAAALAQYGGKPVPYHLDKSENCGISIQSIEATLEKARADGVSPRALVVINPGNATGTLLTVEEQERIVRLCEQNRIVLIAVEVYQNNVHNLSLKFTSFKKVVRSLQSPVPLISFHSISKGVFGECGRRGGYFECENISDDIIALLYKIVSVSVCIAGPPPVLGQIGVDTMVRPPQPGDASYHLWLSETTAIYDALASRTHTMATGFL